MRRHAYRINLTANEKNQLEQRIRKQTASQNIVKRAKIILLSNEGKKMNKEISKILGIAASKITVWTKRWIDRTLDPVEERLSDLPRSGSPSRVTQEQWCQIMALACKPPENYGYPITNWTHRELIKEVIKQGIVDNISISHVGNFLKNTIAVISQKLNEKQKSRFYKP